MDNKTHALAYLKTKGVLGLVERMLNDLARTAPPDSTVFMVCALVLLDCNPQFSTVLDNADQVPPCPAARPRRVSRMIRVQSA